MNNILKKIDDLRHIEIVSDAKHLAVASAFYTLLITMHKKVSFVCCESDIGVKFSFLPWFEKIKTIRSSTCDLSINIDFTGQEFFLFLEEKNIKINKKMATALYTALVYESDFFTKDNVSGISFATAGKLLELGVEHKLCIEHIKMNTLSFLRLKSLMLKHFVLKDNAKTAVFYICDDDLKSSGATLKDAFEILKESFSLKYVERAMLLDKDNNNNKIIKILNKDEI